MNAYDTWAEAADKLFLVWKEGEEITPYIKELMTQIEELAEKADIEFLSGQI